MIDRLKDWLHERRIRRLSRRLAIAWTSLGGSHARTQRLYAGLVQACKTRSDAQIARMHNALIAKARR
jgi:hypothetical protein